jgi:hypothetical protein
MNKKNIRKNNMPYDNECAKHQTITDFVLDSSVRESLKGFNRLEIHKRKYNPVFQRINAHVSPSNFIPDHVVAIDGSNLEISLDQEWNLESMCPMPIATVTMDMKKYRSLTKELSPRLHDLESCVDIEVKPFTFAGRNIVLNGEDCSESSFRKSLYEQLEGYRMFSFSETLLDTYEALLEHKDKDPNSKCPILNCLCPDKKFDPKNGLNKCACKHQYNIYSTDALGLHKRINHSGPNGDSKTQVMRIIEHLILMNYIRSFEITDCLDLINKFAFIVDGLLAVFQEANWLSQAIHIELARINEIVKAKTGKDILIFGVEKTGQFVDHLSSLDLNEYDLPGKLPAQTTMLLDDSYIRNNITFSSSSLAYGTQHYFGRKFFYKTTSNNIFVVSVPFYNRYQRNITIAEVGQFPRLPDVLSLLEALESSRYPNALVPISIAHSKASLPSDMGQKIFRNFFNENILNFSDRSDN